MEFSISNVCTYKLISKYEYIILNTEIVDSLKLCISLIESISNQHKLNINKYFNDNELNTLDEALIRFKHVFYNIDLYYSLKEEINNPKPKVPDYINSLYINKLK